MFCVVFTSVARVALATNPLIPAVITRSYGVTDLNSVRRRSLSRISNWTILATSPSYVDMSRSETVGIPPDEGTPLKNVPPAAAHSFSFSPSVSRLILFPLHRRRRRRRPRGH